MYSRQFVYIVNRYQKPKVLYYSFPVYVLGKILELKKSLYYIIIVIATFYVFSTYIICNFIKYINHLKLELKTKMPREALSRSRWIERMKSYAAKKLKFRQANILQKTPTGKRRRKKLTTAPSTLISQMGKMFLVI